MNTYELPRAENLAAVPQWETLDHAITHWASTRPAAAAYVEPAGRLTWVAYDHYITLLAAHLVELGLERGEHVAIWMPDGCAVHVAMSACMRAGLVFTGIGPRSGEKELRHLLTRGKATTLLTVGEVNRTQTRPLFERLAAELPQLRRYVDVYDTVPMPDGTMAEALDTTTGAPVAADRLEAARQLIDGRRIRVDELALLNSTSGTTGLPKCVAHDERRWLKYHQYAVDAGALTTNEVFMSVVPAAFGFGLWTAHFTPTLLGAPTVVIPRFDVEATLRMLEQEHVTVFTAVSTQFVMLLGHPDFDSFDLSSLRVMYTGGEAVPYSKSLEFEERTGTIILNMYGSNETGVQSYTTVDDPRERRLTTGGRIIPEVDVRMFDEEMHEIAFADGPGRPGSLGTVRSQGYYEDEAANRQLFTPGGWMLMGDLVTIDDEGYLTVVGRTSDFIIRGGKNISAPAVEEEVSTLPGLIRCAAVAMPDEVFGERVCIYVVPAADVEISLDDVRAHLESRGVSKEWFPEYLVSVEELPVAPGGKLAKSDLREDIRRRMAELGVVGRQ